MKKNIYLFSLLLLLAAACDKYDEYYLNVPSYGEYSLAGETKLLTDQSKMTMEGIYRVTRGNEMLGDTVVLKWTSKNQLLSVFGRKQGVYCVMEGGYLDSLVLFEGYWRYALSDNTGLLRFYIKDTEGGRSVINGEENTGIILRGAYFNGNGMNGVLELVRIQTFTAKLRNSKFAVMAHRAGGRTADKLPVSENSCAMVNFTERLGSNGIEIDVQITKDGVPVLYHDNDINIRLTQKGPVMGPLTGYTFQQLRTMVKLYHGEPIPTLREMLDTVLYNTNLRYVWLDNKEPESLAYIAPIQQEYLAKAQAMGRELYIVMGLPDKARVDAYLALPDRQNIPALCEVSVDEVERSNAKVYAPRWTMGIQTSAVQQMHNENRFCFVWTLDDPQFMREFILQGQFDGILTNYPTLLSYYHYVYHNN